MGISEKQSRRKTTTGELRETITQKSAGSKKSGETSKYREKTRTAVKRNAQAARVLAQSESYDILHASKPSWPGNPGLASRGECMGARGGSLVAHPEHFSCGLWAPSAPQTNRQIRKSPGKLPQKSQSTYDSG